MEHEVKFSTPALMVGNADLIFVIKQNGKKFGELRLSRGSLIWFPKDKSKSHRLSWADLNELAQSKKATIDKGRTH
jgi:hypothetical protein